MDDLRIDSHKLMYHAQRVSQWLAKGDICPLYVEVGPSGACNHRCIFCALDYIGYKKRFINTNIFKKRLQEMAKCGVKSMMYAGEGEPLLHPDISELIAYTKKAGIDVSVTSNGVLFTQELAKKCLGSLSWIRFSIDAGTASTYSKVHCCRENDFDKVLNNLKYAIRLRKEKKYSTTIGAQFLLLPENYNEATELASTLKDIGVDYLIIKPFSQHPMSHNKLSKNFRYSDYFYLKEELQKISNDNFKVIFRIHTMEKILDRKRHYQHCLGIPFWAYIDSTGGMWACSAYLGNTKFRYGNIIKNTFKEVWQSKRRKQIVKMAATKLDTTICREACRLDEINEYLWELKHPHPHVNFI